MFPSEPHLDPRKYGLTMTARAYAIMPFVWSVGTIIGPIIGGTCADPSSIYPSIFPPSGLFGMYPYLLPNLMCALLLLISIVLGYYWLEETHPDRQVVPCTEAEPLTAHNSLIALSGATEHSGVDLRAESYGTFNAVDMTKADTWEVNADGSAREPRKQSAYCGTIWNKRIIMLTIALGIFTYHSMSYDHLLPIFLQDNRNGVKVAAAKSAFDIPGGLGLSLQQVGLIMSVNGLIALIIQGVVFPCFAGWLGVWRVFLVVTLLHPIAYIMMPYLAFLPEKVLYPGIYAALVVRNFLSILAYPVILILLKEATPSPSVLGKVNGLAASAGAACRTVAPPVAGWLYSIGARHGFTGLAWWGSALVALVGAVQCWFIEREKHRTTHVQCAAAALTGESQPLLQKQEVIRISVDDPEMEV